MSLQRQTFSLVGAAVAAAFSISCAGEAPDNEPEAIGAETSALTAQQRFAACAQDPRVIAGLVSQKICAGADIFFRETFNGNGRTCGTCHPVGNNTTIDPTFVANLRQTNPSDPLFVFENNPDLANLEHTSDMNQGGILENVDGFEDPVNKFVVRSVPHVLSLQMTTTADTGDLTTIPPNDRTGWGGDGAPGDGTLRSFLTGAVTQHYTKTLNRVPGVDFRLPTSDELDYVEDFQRALGRLNELDLTQVNLTDADANEGRRAFIDPQRGRCNVCHFNAGANSQDTGKNRNFDTGTRLAPIFTVPQFNGNFIFDGGFGGKGLAQPNIVTFPLGDPSPNDGFGTNTFNTPSLIEAADTSPFFHTNAFNGGIEFAVFFYTGAQFPQSQASKDLVARFGTPIQFSPDDGVRIARFLRTLNVAFNLDLGKQRLRAALTLANRFGDTGLDIQKQLLVLGGKELDDAVGVLTGSGPIQPFYPDTVNSVALAKSEIAAALAAPASSRAGHISNAVSRVENARDPIGANVTFNLGQGNLMF